MPRARSIAASGVAGTGSGRSARTTAPSRRVRRDRKARAARSNTVASRLDDVACGNCLDLGQRQGGGQQHAGRAGAAGNLGDGQERLAGQPVVRRQGGRPAVGHQVFAPARRAPWRCGRDRRAREARPGRRRGRLGRGLRRPAPRRARPAGGQAAHVVGPARAIASGSVRRRSVEVGAVAAEAALDQDRGNLGRRPSRRLAAGGGRDDHAGKARRQGQGVEAPARVGDAAVAVERVEIAQQRPRLGQGRQRAACRERRGASDPPRPRRRNRAAAAPGRRLRISGLANGSSAPVAASCHRR